MSVLERAEVTAWLYVGAVLDALFGFILGLTLGYKRRGDDDPEI